MDNFRLIQHFAEQLGLIIDPNPDGAYIFEVDGLQFSIYDIAELDKIIISGDIGYPPPGNRESLYKSILEAQYMLKSTSGATFSLNPDTGILTLCKILIPAILDNDAFFQEAENFINALHSWADIIRNYRQESALDEQASLSSLNSGFLQV